jgi:parvulin-like peptidyl-prolyl isomerase
MLNRRAINFRTARSSSLFQVFPLITPRIIQVGPVKLSAKKLENFSQGTKKMKTSRKIKFAQITIFVVIAAALTVSVSAIRRTYGNVNRNEVWTGDASIVARVEGRDISTRVYDMYLKNGIQALGLSEANPEGRRQIAQLKEGIVSELIDRALIEIDAERRGLEVAADKLESRYRQRVEEMGGAEAYRNYLNETHITDDEFRRVVKGELAAEMMQQELSKGLTIEPSEAQAFYDKEKANPKYAALFVEPESMRASHILVGARRLQLRNEIEAQGKSNAQLDRYVADEMNKRRARAADLLDQLKRGADFATLARRYSDDPGTRERGGDLGLFTRDTHTPSFDEAAFALKPGQLSEIVETEYGFHIIKAGEHRAQRTRSLDEVRAQIEQQLLTRKRGERLTAWLEARRRAASISINPSYRAGSF